MGGTWKHGYGLIYWLLICVQVQGFAESLQHCISPQSSVTSLYGSYWAPYLPYKEVTELWGLIQCCKDSAKPCTTSWGCVHVGHIRDECVHVHMRTNLNHGIIPGNPVSGHCCGSYSGWRGLMKVHSSSVLLQNTTVHGLPVTSESTRCMMISISLGSSFHSTCRNIVGRLLRIYLGQGLLDGIHELLI